MIMKTGIELIADERERQITRFSAEHDDFMNAEGDLARAGACYAMPEDYRVLCVGAPNEWPWADDDWRPTPDDRIRELIKAGALVAAEIDRMQRQ